MKPFCVDYVVERNGVLGATTKEEFEASSDKVRFVIKTYKYDPAPALTD